VGSNATGALPQANNRNQWRRFFGLILTNGFGSPFGATIKKYF